MPFNHFAKRYYLNGTGNIRFIIKGKPKFSIKLLVFEKSLEFTLEKCSNFVSNYFTIADL